MSKTVLVTGASGFIASHIVKLLIEKGYTVRGTVRDKNDKTKVQHLIDLFPSLQLYEADLLKEGSFDEAVKGCVYVFHTASPFQDPKEDAQKELIEPALKGTLNVLHAVEKSADTVKRVILTSSVAAVAQSSLPAEHVFTEEDWNNGSTPTFEPYRYSKVVAERAAWDFSKGKKWDLVTILPSAVLGPPLSKRTDAISVQNVKNFLDGTTAATGTKPQCFGCCDVRDVAQAHVAAAENPNSKGRYMLATPTAHSHWEISQILVKSGKYSKYPLPTKEAASVTKFPKYNATKTQKELGITFTPLEKSVIDEADALIALGIVPRKE
eukprot:TRINITY_DN2314_c0_g1_i1.p1 TRINITY_DN2314_c0_g1~~TRINITY_DN2314_c0_g1_i1.p1  ORF type:complete len:324 (-),score=62.26 TRINITY_DN2314_c0_g1_i1:13-984(-)